MSKETNLYVIRELPNGTTEIVFVGPRKQCQEELQRKAEECGYIVLQNKNSAVEIIDNKQIHVIRITLTDRPTTSSI